MTLPQRRYCSASCRVTTLSRQAARIRRAAHREEDRVYLKSWNAAHPEKAREYRQRRALDVRAARDGELARGCMDCGEKDPRVLDFDHVRGKKLFHIGKGMNGSITVRTLYAEIDKCEVRCANCHRRVTYDRRKAAIA